MDTPIVLTSYNLLDMHRELVAAALRSAGTIAGAAKLLGVNRGFVQTTMKRAGIPHPTRSR